MVAVAGLTGGAGTTTTTLLLAAAAARDSSGLVMACDTGGLNADLAYYADAHAAQSLLAAAAIVAANRTPKGLFATGPHGIRVIAGAPETDRDLSYDGLARVLTDAKAAHALTVVDCGHLSRPAEMFALNMATHIVWVLPATTNGHARAQRRFDALTTFRPDTEVLLARHDAAGTRAPVSDLSDLAAQRAAPLVLMPHLHDLADTALDAVLDQARTTLQGLAVVLSR